MKVKDILDIDPQDFYKLDEKTLRKYTRQLADAANKRLNRIIQSGLYSPAVEDIGSNKFSTKGKNYKQLQGEFIREYGFLTNQTSTISGIKKIIRQGGSIKGIKGDNKFEKSAGKWDLYGKVCQIDPRAKEKQYKYTVLDIIDVSNGEMSEQAIIDRCVKALNGEDVIGDGYEDLDGFFEPEDEEFFG